MTTISYALQTEGLTKRFGERLAVDDLTIGVPTGALTGFIGPNGSGKSTTIRMLLGLVRPSGGRAVVLGSSTERPEAYVSRVGALVEGPAFYPGLSGRRNLDALATLGGHNHQRVPQLLRQVGLAERGNSDYGSFSMGMKQRLGIAAALLPDPELLILDEPVNGLDPAGIREVRGLLRSLADEGRTVFVSSHLLSELQQISDWVVVIKQGRLVFQGTMEALLEGQSGSLVVRAEDLSQHEIVERICAEAGHHCESCGSRLCVQAPAGWAGELNRRAMKAGVTLVELHLQHGSLEDSFLAITGEEDR